MIDCSSDSKTLIVARLPCLLELCGLLSAHLLISTDPLIHHRIQHLEGLLLVCWLLHLLSVYCCSWSHGLDLALGCPSAASSRHGRAVAVYACYLITPHRLFLQLHELLLQDLILLVYLNVLGA